jgi:hypothetical protein
VAHDVHWLSEADVQLTSEAQPVIAVQAEQTVSDVPVPVQDCDS